MNATIYTQAMVIDGVEYTFEQDTEFTAEEMAAIESAPYAYILAGNDGNIEEFVRGELVADQVFFITDEGEYIVLAYEEISVEQHDWTQDNDVVYYEYDMSAE